MTLALTSMPLFRDKRGRFFLLPDDVVEQFAIQHQYSADTSRSSDITTDAGRVADARASQSTCVAIVIVIPNGRTHA
jgi:hypothetical protein